jgi:hypothetical protein
MPACSLALHGYRPSGPAPGHSNATVSRAFVTEAGPDLARARDSARFPFSFYSPEKSYLCELVAFNSPKIRHTWYSLDSNLCVSLNNFLIKRTCLHEIFWSEYFLRFILLKWCVFSI